MWSKIVVLVPPGQYGTSIGDRMIDKYPKSTLAVVIFLGISGLLAMPCLAFMWGFVGVFIG